MKKLFLFFLGVFCVTIAIFSEQDLFLKLDKVLIETQYKMPTRLTNISENIYLFDAKFLETHNVLTLKDLIQLISRTYLSRYRTGEGLIFSNGIINSHNERFLLLIDGIPIDDPLYNHSYIDEYYPLTNVKQIEISFGPFSSLYGTGGFAGYINIIHNNNPGKQIIVNTENSEKMEANIIINTRGKDFELETNILYLKNKGFGIDINQKGQPVLPPDNPEENIFFRGKIKYKDLSFILTSIGYRSFELSQAMYTWQDIFQNRIENYIKRDLFLTLSFKHDFSKKINFKTNINYFYYDRSSLWGYNIYSSTNPNIIEESHLIKPKKISEKISGEILLNIMSENKNADFLCGINWEYIMLKDIKDYEYINNSDEYIEPSSFYLDPINYFNFAPFSQITLNNILKKFKLVVSARYDYNHFFKGFISPKVTLGYNFLKNIHLGFTYGKAFRAPTPREMLIKTSDWTEGNQDLKPEEIESFSFTIKYIYKYFYIFTDIFKQDLIDLIEKKEIASHKYSYENIGTEHIWGGNMFIETNIIKKFQIILDLTYTYALVGNKNQYDYPKIKVTQFITYKLNNYFNIALANIYVGEREREDWNALKENGKPYFLSNLSFIFDSNSIHVSIYIKNLFDQSYYTMYYVDNVYKSYYTNDIIMPRRTVGAKVSYDF